MGPIFQEGGVDYGSVAYSGEEWGYILEGLVDSERVAYLREGWYILGGRGRFWEGGIDSRSIAYSCKKGDIF